MSTNTPAYTLTNAHVRFRTKRLFRPAREHHILKGVSLTVRRGEALGIIGLNGAGKSTLLRLMAGILEPDSGSVVNHGVTSALLSFSGGLFPECSGRANAVMLLMLQQKISAAEAEAMVDKVTAYAELEHAIDRPLRTYSTGMLARLKFAIATQADPDVLLVDELLAVGDTAFAMKSYATMAEKLSSGGTSVLATHLLDVVSSFCQRAVWVEHGRIVAEGGAEYVVAAYKDSLAIP